MDPVHKVLHDSHGIMSIVMDYIGKDSYIPMAIISRHFYSSWEGEKETSWKYVCQSKKSITRFAPMCGSHFLCRCIISAAKVGKTRELKRIHNWFNNNNVKLIGKRSHETMISAASSDSMETVKWCFNKGYNVDSRVLLKAISNKNLSMVKYLVKNKCKSSIQCDWKAASLGQVDILKEINPMERFDCMTMCYAAKNGRWNVVQYLNSVGCPVDERVALMAAFSGKIENVRMIIEVFEYPWDETLVILCRKLGLREIEQYAIENGCPHP